jgi:hypothetical protein
MRHRLAAVGCSDRVGFVRHWGAPVRARRNRARGGLGRACRSPRSGSFVRKAGWRWPAASGSFGALARVGRACAVATRAWPRRLVVSEFLTISATSVQTVHATLGIRGVPGRAGRGRGLAGGGCAGGVRLGFVRQRGRSERAAMRCAAGPRVRSARVSGRAGVLTGVGFVRREIGPGWRRCDVLPALGFVWQYHVLQPAHASSLPSALALGSLRPTRPGAALPTRVGTRIADDNGHALRRASTGHGGILLGS